MACNSSNRTDIKNDEIISMLKQGVAMEKIAAHFDCSYSLVQRRAALCKWNFREGRGGKLKKASAGKKKKMCIRCGVRSVPAKPLTNGTQLTRLCPECFRLGSRLSTTDNSWSEVRIAIARGF